MTTPAEPAEPVILSDLVEQATVSRPVAEIQAAARQVVETHTPDRPTIAWTLRWRILPWPRRQHVTCEQCGDTFPCDNARYAAQLQSAGRLAIGRLVAADSAYPSRHPPTST